MVLHRFYKLPLGDEPDSVSISIPHFSADFLFLVYSNEMNGKVSFWLPFGVIFSPSPEGQTIAEQVTDALETASDTVSDVGAAAVTGTTEVLTAVVGTAAELSNTVQDIVAVIGAAVGRKLQADDTQN
jgi:hypothetical protein